MKKTIIESMLNQTLHNSILNKVKEGTLVHMDGTIYVINNNNKYFLTYAPYEDLENNVLDKKTRKEICNIFLNEYSFADIIDIYKKQIEERERKYELANKNIIELEKLINEYDLKQYGESEILFNHNTIESYVEFKKEYKYDLEIYIIKDNIYKIRYNYDWMQINKNELTKLIEEMIKNIEKDIEDEKEKRKKELEEHKQFENKKIFAKNVSSGYIAIIKLKSSYQCLEGGLRYTVGKGVGKFYSLKGISNIIDYLDKKDIKEYAYISEEELEGITIKDLKQLEYKKF